MVCPKCKNDGVLNNILGKEFWYCRTCKEEIELELVESSPSLQLPTEEEFRKQFEDFVRRHGGGDWF